MTNYNGQSIHFAPLIEDIELGRIVGKIENKKSEKLLIISTGIHGNEPSGLFAARKVIRKLQLSKLKLKGTLIVLAGNLEALKEDVRYIDEDLNRVWSQSKIHSFLKEPKTYEEYQAKEIHDIIALESQQYPQRYFLDCHTTSSETMPYISAHDALGDHQFARQFPVHTVVGFSKYINSSIDDFFRSQGFVGFTFEAGHHHAFTSLENQEAMMWLFLCKSGLLNPNDLTDHDECRRLLAKYSPDGSGIFHIHYRHALENREAFEMKPGYVNFQKIKKGEILATEWGENVLSHLDGRILMPLYQKLGNDGYFIIAPHHQNN